MADITLSKAVRSNLLNLQSTASQLGKTQERLATGLKVNSALDNPTNFFTASSLNSRAGDLGRLLDAVGNATQTIEAADNGLSAITKLVESAQATARQALQTTGAVTANSVEGSTSATYNPSTFTTVSGDNSVASGGPGPLDADTAATRDIGTFAADGTDITATGAALKNNLLGGTIAADADIAALVLDDLGDSDTALSATTPAFADGEDFTITVNGTAYGIQMESGSGAAAVSSDVLTIGVDQDIQEFASGLSTLLSGSGVTVQETDGQITLTSDSTVDSLKLAGSASGSLADLGLDQGGSNPGSTSTGGANGEHLFTRNSAIQDLAAVGDKLTISSGSTPTTVDITFGDGAGEVSTLAGLVSKINASGTISATDNTTGLTITSEAAGDALEVNGFQTDGTTAKAGVSTALGFTDDTPQAVTAQKLGGLGIASGDSLVVSVDGTDYTVNFDANSAASQSGNTLTIGADQTLSSFATALNTALGANVTAAVSAGGVLSLTSSTSDSIRVADGTQGTAVAELGLGAVGAGADTTDQLLTNNADIQALAAAGATLSISVGGTAQGTLTFGDGAGEISNKSDLITALGNMADLDATGSASDGNTINLTVSDSNDADSAIVITADSATTLAAFNGLSADAGSTVTSTKEAVNLVTRGDVNQGDSLDIKVGNSATLTVTFGTGTGEVSTVGELNAALQNLAGGSASVDSNGEINITSDIAGQPIEVGGSTTALKSFGLTAGETSSMIDGTNLAAGDKLNIQIGTNSQLTVTFGTGTGQVNTFDELQTALSNLAGGSATIDRSSGAITIEATNGADDIVISATDSADADKAAVASSFGLSAGTTTATTTDSSQRATLETQYNDLLTQINELSEDASFNGVNLLNGDDLNVIFNEDGSSTLDIQGVTFNATGLGLSRVASSSFQEDSNINNVLDALDGAINSLRSQSSTFGSNLSVVETRQDFTKEMINTLETGGANLTLADSNEEAANLLALQTRQQLSSTALSLASQSDQNVLRLF